VDKDDHELIALRRRVALLTEEARKNDAAWRRAQRREMELLEAAGLAELLGKLTRGLKDSYRLAAVTLTLADPEHELRHLLRAQSEDAADFSAVRFVDSMRELAPLLASSKPWLGRFSRADHGSLFADLKPLASVALLPLVRQGRLIGSLNFGSLESQRFSPGLGTEFLGHLAAIASFAIENAVNRAKLVRSGVTDVLTGWHNRRYLQLRLKEELVRCRRDRSPLTCLMIDIDHFKGINDRFGHLAGDEVLRRLAQRIGKQVRGSDVSARYGGEEFVVLLPGTSIEIGFLLAERIRGAVASETVKLPPPHDDLAVTVSIGVAEHRSGEADEDLTVAAERLLASADLALYEAKARGRNAVVEAGNR